MRRNKDNKKSSLVSRLIKETNQLSLYKNPGELVKMIDQMKNDYSSDENLTPTALLLLAFKDAFGTDLDKSHLDKIEKMSKIFTEQFSLRATKGKDKTIFGPDLNSVCKCLVESLNMCGKMRQMLIDNGIEPPSFLTD